MAEAYKGLIIRIGADTAKLQKALQSSDRAIRETQKQLRLLERAARLDPASLGVFEGRLDAVTSQAATLRRRFATCNDALRRLESKGVDKLADNTRDAAHQAEKTAEAYAKICHQIKAYKNEVARSKGFDPKKDDPFKGAEGYQATLAVLKRIGATEKEIAQYSSLVAEYWSRLAEKDIAGQVNAFKQLKVQMAANSAEARALYLDLARLEAENPAAKQTKQWRECAGSLKSMEAAAEAVRGRMRRLDEAFRIDPTGVDAVRQRLHAMQDGIDVNEKKILLLNEQLDRLRANGAESTARSVKGLAVETEEAKNRLASLNMRLDDLRASRGFDEQGEDAKRLNAEISETRARLHALAEAGEFNELNAKMALLAAQTNRMSDDMKRAYQVTNRLRGAVQQFGWSMSSTVTPAIAVFASRAKQSAEEVDSAYRNMRKTVQGTEEQFEGLKRAALDYSRTHFTSADTLLEIEAMGGQLGVATEKLEAFATTVSNIEIATDLDADTASQQLGQLSSILNDMTQDDFARYGDALVRLGNNNATLESKISDVMLRIASMGTITGFSTTELLAWSTAVAATGQGAEAAGTAISKTMADIESAVGAGGDKLRGFADVAGMSSSEFARAWEETPSDAMRAFVEGLNRVEQSGGSASNTLAELGITSVRQKQAVLGLMQTVGGLNDNLQMSENAWNGVSDQWGDAGDAAREADRKAEGFSGAVRMLANNVQALGSEMGESLAPVIKACTAAVAVMTQAYSAAPDVVKHLINVTLALAASMGPVVVAANAVVNAWSSLSKLLKEQAAFRAAKAGMGAVGKETAAATAQTVANTAATEAGAAAEGRQAAAKKAGAAAQAADASATTANTAATKANTAATTAGTRATKLLKASMSALPWAAAAFLAMELVSAITEYAAKVGEARRATDGMRDAVAAFGSEVEVSAAKASASVRDIQDSAQEAIGAQADLATEIRRSGEEFAGNSAHLDAYVEAIERLAGKSGLTADEQTELKTAVAGVNTICGTSYSVTDALNGVLDVSTEKLKDNTEAWKRNAEAQAAKKAYEDTYAALLRNEQELERLTASMESSVDAVEGLRFSTSQGLLGMIDMNEKAKTLRAAIDADNEALEYFAEKAVGAAGAADGYAGSAGAAAYSTDELEDSVSDAEDELSKLVTGIQEAADEAPAFARALADSGTSVEGFAQMMSDAGLSVSDLESSMESYRDKATDAFGEIGSASELSLDEMLANMQENARVTQQWADNITALYARAGSDSQREFVGYISSLGPQYAAQVQDLVDSADAYLPLFADAMGSGSRAAVDAALAETGLLAPGVEGDVRAALESAEAAIDAGIPASAGKWADLADASMASVASLPADASSVAESASSGFASGISESEDKAKGNASLMAAAGASIARDIENAYAWGAHLSYNFADGIKSNVGYASMAARRLANAVAEQLEHSVPKKGVLSNHGRGEAEWGRHLVQNFVSGMESEEDALREKVAMIPEAVRDAVERAQKYVSGGVSLQSSVASGLSARVSPQPSGQSAAVANTYVVENITVQVREVSDVDPVRVVTEFAKRANRANGR